MVKNQLGNNEIKKITTDVLVIGAGASGLRAAIEASKKGAKVLIISKEEMGWAHSRMAQGGLNVAMKAPATPEQHYKDTIDGGWKINNHRLAKVFSKEMPDRIYDLESYGVKFDRLPDGSFYTWAGGKQSAPLNLCAGDYTGREIIEGLVSEINKLKIPYLDNHFVTKLFVKNKKILGVFAFDLKNGERKIIQSKVTIIASGGAGMMYLVSTNEPTNTGEGYAWGLDAGCELVDMEMVQFHPTGIAYPPHRKGRLITEKVRGHFGILKNKKGERFMTRYQPKRMELAGRDEVARAIYQEVEEGRGTENDGVYLDVTHWEKGKAEKTIPDVLEGFLEDGIDIRKTMMEVYPSMHHIMGGININEWGQTCIHGLYAVGEVTRNIHGANRLGGNSLAEGQVFGRRAGEKSSEEAKKIKVQLISSEMIMDEEKRLDEILNKKKGLKPNNLILKLKKIMWKNVGLIRDEKKLSNALKEIRKLRKEAESARATNINELREGLELNDMLKVAEVVTMAAIMRRESRGAHYRTDFPNMDSEWEKNLSVCKIDGKLKIKTIPVVKE